MSIQDFVIRIVLSILLGLLIGLERQLTGHHGGIKTSMLISLGACMFCLFSEIGDFNDKSRIAAQVVSGVGFLCSGVIFKDGINVNGLNTAATIWCTAAIGVITSTGETLLASIATVILILANVIFKPLSDKIYTLDKFDEREKFYKINVICKEDVEGFVRSLIIEETKDTNLILTNIESSIKGEHKRGITAILYCKGKRNDIIAENILTKLALEKEVYLSSWNYE